MREIRADRLRRRSTDPMFDVVQKIMCQDAQTLGEDFRIMADRVEGNVPEWLVTGTINGSEILGYIKITGIGQETEVTSHAIWFKDQMGC